MTLLTVPYYLVMLTVCGLGIFLSFRLYRDFYLKFTRYLHYYVILTNAFGLAMFFLWDIMNQVFFVSSGLNSNIVFTLFQLLMLPAVWFFTYMFVLFTSSLVDTAPGKKFKYAFVGYGLFSAIVLSVSFAEYIDSGTEGIYVYLYWVLVIIAFYIIKSWALWHTVRRLNSVSETARRKMVFRVSGAYFVMLTLYKMVLVLCLVFSGTYPLVPQMYFMTNVVPLLFACHYLYRYQLKTHAAEITTQMLNYAVETHDISRREREIVELIIKGKSNREIEGLLFISEKTVKNHVYNVFRKTGVHSRTQLINVLMSLEK